jgi:hypothetical protein
MLSLLGLQSEQLNGHWYHAYVSALSAAHIDSILTTYVNFSHDLVFPDTLHNIIATLLPSSIFKLYRIKC